MTTITQRLYFTSNFYTGPAYPLEGWDATTDRRRVLSPYRDTSSTGPDQTPLDFPTPGTGRATEFVTTSILPAGSFTGSFTACVNMTRQSLQSGMLSARLRVYLRAVDGSTRVLADVTAAGTMTTSQVPTWFFDVPIPVTATQDGDRLVVDVGAYRHNGTRYASHRAGATTEADMPRGETTVVNGRATWIDFAWTPYVPDPDPDPEPEPEPIAQTDRAWTRTLATALDLDPVAAQPVVTVRTPTPEGWTVDPALSGALAGYAITYGRDGATGPVGALVCTLELATARVTTAPQIADRVRVQLADVVAAGLELAPDDVIRFTGEVTDVVTDHAAGMTRATCVGRLARAGRVSVDPAAWPVESDHERVHRILTASTLDLTPGTIDHGGVTLGTGDKPATIAALVSSVVESTGGQILETLAGDIDYHDRDHRRGTGWVLSLSAPDVFRALTWSQHVGDVVNAVTVEYGADVSVHVTDPASADPATGLGPYPATVTTQLTTPGDAYSLGTLLVGRGARPAWQLPDLTVDLTRTLSLAQLATLMTVRHGDRVHLADFPSGCPVPPVVLVEGWTETATATAWRMALTVTDPLVAGVSIRWKDVPPADHLTWAGLDPALTWLDVARIESPTDLTT